MRIFVQKIGAFAVAGLLLMGCQSEQEIQQKNTDKKEVVAKEKAEVKITPEEEKEIRIVIDEFVQTTNEKNFEQHMALFSTKMVGAEDFRTQKEAAFQREEGKLELHHVQVKHFQEDFAVVETEEQETEHGTSVQKKVNYALGKEEGQWKIEEVRVIEQK